MSQTHTAHSPSSTEPHCSFRSAVAAGLGELQKQIPCKYLYDDEGSELFEEICQAEDYYPTRTEMAIMDQYVDEMADAVGPRCLLLELGSGSSLKTRLLLKHLHEPAGYVPVEISPAALEQAVEELHRRFPDLEILPVCADYHTDFSVPSPSSPVERTVIYFPGSTIGNMTPDGAAEFLRHMHAWCGAEGGVLLGVDLQKSEHVLERAYNDGEGVTSRFNLNLLKRMNRELGADFETDEFSHQAVYNSDEGRVEMHLVSDRDQVVTLDGQEFHFREGESIHTENSYKYTLSGFAEVARAAGWKVEKVWTDASRFFSIQYLTVDMDD